MPKQQRITNNTFIKVGGANAVKEDEQKRELTEKEKQIMLLKFLGINLALLLLACFVLFVLVYTVRLALTI